MITVFRLLSWCFHPVVIPMAGVCAYFLASPKHTTLAIQASLAAPVGIITLVIPLVAYEILSNVGVLKSKKIIGTKDLGIVLAVYVTLLLIVLFKVLPKHGIVELYFYLLGLICGFFSSLVLLLFRVKVSMYMLGMGALLMYLVSLSIHFEINITLAISVFVLLTGVVASVNLYDNKSSGSQLLIGFLLGALAQVLTISYWL